MTVETDDEQEKACISQLFHIPASAPLRDEMDSNMELGAQINPFSPELPLVWIFYHSVRNRTSIGAQREIHLDGQLRTSCAPSSAHPASLGKLIAAS